MGNSKLKSVLNSIFYRSSYLKATKLAKNSKGILLVLATLFTKVQSEKKGSPFKIIVSKLKTLGLLLKYYAKGDYRDVEIKNVVIILAGIIYFLSPIDFIPDMLPVVGFADDIALVTFIYNSVADEIERFELWLINRNVEVREVDK